MRQALHIFAKDIRYLRYEIALVLAIDGVFAAMHAHAAHGLSDSWWAEIALVVAVAFLIGRLVLAEAIPGDSQFWITRPYRWQSLLGAKLLFIAAFVNLPVLLAHLFILMMDGFPLLPSLPGLLWTQVLLFVFASMPFAALASLSAGMATLIFAQSILLAAGFSLLELVQPFTPRRLYGVEWVTDSIVLFLLAATAIPVLFIQYRSRRTLLGRTAALLGIAGGTLAFIAMPWTAALAVQAHFSKQPALGSSIQISSGHGSEQPYWLIKPKTALYLPISIEGIPDGTEIQADALKVSLQTPDGRHAGLSVLDCADLRRETLSAHSAVLYATCFTDPAFFQAERDQPVSLHASLYFTLFGNARSKTIPLSAEPSNAVGGLQCYTDTIKEEWDVYCRSAFRWPARLVYARLSRTNANSFAQFVSYSPFPAGLNIDPVETRWASAYAAGPPADVRDVTIIVEEPLTHSRRDIEARGLFLTRTGSQVVVGVPPQKVYIP
jgi:hypothetical protein